MNKKLFMSGVMLAVFVLLANAVFATVTISAITPTTAVEDTQTNFVLTANTTNLNGTAVYALVNGPTGMSIDSTTGDLTWTPINDHVGANSVEVRADDSDGTGATFLGSVSVSNVNDAPVLTAIGNKDTFEGFALSFTVLASDVDVGDALTYSSTNLPSGANFDINTQSFTWTPNEDQIGEHSDIEFRVTDVAGATDFENVTISVELAKCDSGDETKIDITDIDFDDDKYKIGENVNVDVDVEAPDEDLDDVEVEICLYNVNQNKEVDCWDADGSGDINEDDEEKYDLEFTIPNDEEVGNDDDYLLIVSVTADDENNDKQCIQESDDIRIDRESHDVMVDSVRLNPSTVSAGESVQITVRVENIGTKDEDDVFVELIDNVLGLDYESNRFDLDDFAGSDNDHTVRFLFRVPDTVAEGTYVVQPNVYFDDDDETSSDEFASLRVRGAEGSTPSGNGGSTSTGTPASLSVTTDTNIDAGEDFANLHLVVNNMGSQDLTGTLSFSPIGSWASSISGQAVSLHPGQNNLYFNLDVKNAKPGMNSATVTISPSGSSNFDQKLFTLNFEVREGDNITGNVVSDNVSFFRDRGTGFWVVVDVIAIVLALIFIKIVFGRKRTI